MSCKRFLIERSGVYLFVVFGGSFTLFMMSWMIYDWEILLRQYSI